MKYRDFDKVVRKFAMRTRDGNDRWAWFEHDGKVVAKARRSHGRKDAPEHLVRNQLHLSEDEMRGAISCTIKRGDYVKILKQKGII